MSKHPQDDPINERICQRMLMASSRTGRLRLRLYMYWKVNAWRITIQSVSVVKRLMDVFLSTIALIALAPLIVTIALLIKKDGGPIIFKQPRVGRRGMKFNMFKFRSMRVDAEKELEKLKQFNEKGGVTFKMKNDPRITPVGKWIRKASIDELPQLFNVLRGEMSLVGPRPQLPSEVAQYSPSDHHRLLMLPGITCLWQIGEREGKFLEINDRNQIEFPEQVSLDLRYIESQSFWKDFLILLKTIPTVLLGKGGV